MRNIIHTIDPEHPEPRYVEIHEQRCHMARYMSTTTKRVMTDDVPDDDDANYGYIIPTL